jgi:hypothetical protein
MPISEYENTSECRNSSDKVAVPRLILKGIILSWGLFAFSLFFNGYYVSGEGRIPDFGYPAWTLCLCGFMGFDSVDNLAWFANALYCWVTLMLFARRYRLAVIVSLAAVGLACTGALKNTIVKSASGVPLPITSCGPGFYFWLLAMVTILVVSIIGCVLGGRLSSTGVRNR